LAAFLQQRLALRPGDRVLLASHNCPQFVTAFYAVLRAGAVVVPVSPMSKAQELRFYAQDSGARVAFVAQEMLADFASAGLDALIVHAYADTAGAQCPADEVPDWVAVQRRPLTGAGVHAFEDEIGLPLPLDLAETAHDDLAVLPYTSGTTDHPKGCMH